MTPKEKAEELVNKYYQRVADGSAPEDNAKQCALIAVDEILNQDTSIYDKTEAMYHLEYWGNVKEEIEAL